VRAAATAVGVAALLVAGSGVAVAVRGLPEPAAAAPPPAASPAASAAAVPVPVEVPLPSPGTPVAAPAPPAVRALAGLAVPDLVVRADRSLSEAQVRRLRRLEGVTALAVLDPAAVRVGGAQARLAGVDPSQFRAFTPQETAASDPVWEAVARGELVPTHGLASVAELPLGRDVAVQGRGERARERVGALAAFGVPAVDAVLDRAGAASYGAVRNGSVLLAAPERDVEDLTAAVRAVVGEQAEVVSLRPVRIEVPEDRPRTYRELYVQSATYCPGMRWQLLAAVGQVESGHGKNLGPSSAGALGPMQFLPSTWASYGVDGDGDGDADINDPYDAVPAAALYLCRYGGGGSGQALYDAVYAYNHLDSYVQTVLDLADRYE